MQAQSQPVHAANIHNSNGIRFTIFDLSPSQARNLSTIYQHRSAESLYDAQYIDGVKKPISPGAISRVTAELQRFRVVCDDYCVPAEHIHVVATEATRSAFNADAFLRRIKKKAGLTVRLLSQAEESRYGALGVASSLPHLDGVILDLGGGSVQMSWMQTQAGDIEPCSGSDVAGSSIPYGTAALTQRMRQETEPQALNDLRRELTAALQLIWTGFNGSAAQQSINLYLSGGGFRGLGYALMARKGQVNPYPISSVAGFEIKGEELLSLAHELSRVEPMKLPENNAVTATANGRAPTAMNITVSNPKSFGVSKRRASQIPAIAMVVECLKDVLPKIDHVTFVQGGVREGLVFDMLPKAVRSQVPLDNFVKRWRSTYHNTLLNLLKSAIPAGLAEDLFDIFSALIAAIDFHSLYPKDTRPSAALHSTTTGNLGELNGLTHWQRAALAVLLCERWGGKIPPADERFLLAMLSILGAKNAWWCSYAGRIAALIGDIYPGNSMPKTPRIEFAAILEGAIKLTITWPTSHRDIAPVHGEAVDGIRKIGQRKNWIDGFGHTVKVFQPELKPK